MRHLTCNPKAETLGTNVLAFFSNLREENTRPIAEKYGLVNVQPTQWIPTHDFLDSLNDLAQGPDFTSGLVAIGMQIGKIVPIPAEITQLGDVLMGWNFVYQSLHRNADVGELKCERIEDKHYKMTFTDLYPDDFSYGIMYGYAQRFLPQGADFTIYYDPEVTPRDRGGEKGMTIIHARWK